MARLLITFATLSSYCHAWHAVGSQAALLVTQSFLSPSATQQCQHILADSSETFLASAASWATDYSQTAKESSNVPYHWLLAEDTPPSDCNTSFARDCPAHGCLATAIANDTGILADADRPRAERAVALKMLSAMVLENAQPNHNDRYTGLNVPVLWRNTSTNLYDVWNRGMPTALAGGEILMAATAWSEYLIDNLHSGFLFPRKMSWLRDLSLCFPAHTSMVWAKDANAYMCSAVLPNGSNVLEGQELSGDYLTNNTAVVHRQVAKGGYRLAAWLNLVLTGDPRLPVPDNGDLPMCNTVTLPSIGASGVSRRK